jgi:hypothetical protein
MARTITTNSEKSMNKKFMFALTAIFSPPSPTQTYQAADKPILGFWCSSIMHKYHRNGTINKMFDK